MYKIYTGFHPQQHFGTKISHVYYLFIYHKYIAWNYFSHIKNVDLQRVIAYEKI
jgi:hypothetical protein